MAEETLATLHDFARKMFRAARVANPDFDAKLLVEWVTHTTPLDVLRTPERLISGDATILLRRMIERRISGEPVYRIIGEREFYGSRFRLSQDTLEPRPDTETLVNLVLPFLRERIVKKEMADLIDLGTGTGAIAIALLSQLQNLRALGVDIAPGALVIAHENAELAKVSRRFSALQSDWFANVIGKYDLIVSNPPYIPRHIIASLDLEVRNYDPIRALDGGEDGLDCYRALAKESSTYLYSQGIVGVEIGAGQKADVEKIFAEQGFRLIESAKDVSGHVRALLFRP